VVIAAHSSVRFSPTGGVARSAEGGIPLLRRGGGASRHKFPSMGGVAASADGEGFPLPRRGRATSVAGRVSTVFMGPPLLSFVIARSHSNDKPARAFVEWRRGNLGII